MKVIISCFGYFGANTGGGNTALQVACYLRAQSALKRVLCMDYDDNRVRELDDFAIRVIPKWSIQNIASGLLGKIEQVLGLGTARYSRICGEKLFDRTSVQYLTEADILHCIRPVVPRTIEAAHRLGIITTARSATCHARFNKGMIEREREKYGLPCIDTYCDEARVRRMEEVYERLDWIITWYDFVAQTYVDYGVPRDKIRVLHVPSGFKEPVKVKRSSKGKLEVLYVAHTNLLKGLHYLLGAWEDHELHKIGQLTVCGTVDANTRKIIKREGWSLPGVEFVAFAKTHPYYERADLVIVPSLSEGDSAVPREAMAYGIPVIVTEHCGTREIVERFKTGIVVPVRDAQAIAEAVMRLYKSSEWRQYLGRNAQRIAGEFTWQRYSQRLFEEFEALLRKQGNDNGLL